VSRAEASGRLDAYLARLDAALADVPAEERRDILLETRGHVLEQTGRTNRGVDAVLAELGAPEEYARRFRPGQDDAEEAAAADEPAPRPGALHDLARLATGGWKTLPLLFVVAFWYAIALMWLCVAVLKLLAPSTVGYWMTGPEGHRRFSFIGISPEPRPGTEVVGYALVPIALLLALVIHFAVSRGLRMLYARWPEPGTRGERT
jgi:uncharacterized membrane protein